MGEVQIAVSKVMHQLIWIYKDFLCHHFSGRITPCDDQMKAPN